MEYLKQCFEEYDDMDVKLYCEKAFELNDILTQFVERGKHQSVTEIRDIALKAKPWMKIHLLSFIMQYDINAENTNMLLRYVCDSSLGISSKFFIFYQVIRLGFLNSNYMNEETDCLLRKLYRQVYECYKSIYNDKMRFIPTDERDKDLVIFLTSQFLSENHGPTKTILDRCEVIRKKLNKKVLIINTAEFLSNEGVIPFYDVKLGNYYEHLHIQEYVEYHGEKYAYIQCDNNMPNVNDVGALLNVILNYKPYCIVNIGGNSIASDICSNVVPTIAVNTVFSGFTITEGQFQVIGRKMSEADKEIVRKWNRHDNHVIESVFTFSFKEQKHKYVREDFGLPQDKFIAVIVGGRLTTECSDEFVECLIAQMEKGLYVVFVGGMDQYEQWCMRSEIFKQNSKFLGFQDDVLAVDEICDLYINPPRTGGGTAIIEAMYKGLPAITLNKGDSAVSAGPEFRVSTLEEMGEQITQYMSNHKYYEIMSNKAKERAAKMMDSSREFIDVLERIEKLPEFHKKIY